MIEVEYDPSVISYEELLQVFWTGHDPTTRPYSRQYASIIFYHDAEQQRLALETRDRVAAEMGEVYTEIVPASTFYQAEGYHQKYRLRNIPDLLGEFQVIYPDEQGFVDSTAAARVNGYVGGFGTLADLTAELEDLGLSPAGQERLRDIVTRYGR
jgi:peptide-methionine (S)-S-oxide reductase